VQVGGDLEPYLVEAYGAIKDGFRQA
jgi:hypothetical protein